MQRSLNSSPAPKAVEYDEAIRFFVEKPGFDLEEDSCLEPEQPGKRWVMVKPMATSNNDP
jgi:hypothetical protein